MADMLAVGALLMGVGVAVVLGLRTIISRDLVVLPPAPPDTPPTPSLPPGPPDPESVAAAVAALPRTTRGLDPASVERLLADVLARR